jgi:Flp pilus assembly protein TadD
METLDDQRGRAAVAVTTPAELSLALGSAHFRSGSLPEAEREHLAAAGANPRLGEAHNNLAVVYMMTGRLDEAARALDRARKSGYKVHPQLEKDVKARRPAR